jgi:hypothetical protein
MAGKAHARVLLEYVRVLAWPLVVVVFAGVYYSEVRGLLNRVSKFTFPGGSLEASTGSAQTKAPADAPDIWFDIQETTLGLEQCIERGVRALEDSGFSPAVRKVLSYGYKGKFVGSVWCDVRPGVVLISVAGPQKELAALTNEVAEKFYGKRR